MAVTLRFTYNSVLAVDNAALSVAAIVGGAHLTAASSGDSGSTYEWRLLSKPKSPDPTKTSGLTEGVISTTSTMDLVPDVAGDYFIQLKLDNDSTRVTRKVFRVRGSRGYVAPAFDSGTVETDFDHTNFEGNAENFQRVTDELDKVITNAALGVTNAAAAQTTANTGVTNAATAQTTANTAVTNAATAQTAANNANTNANTRALKTYTVEVDGSSVGIQIGPHGGALGTSPVTLGNAGETGVVIKGSGGGDGGSGYVRDFGTAAEHRNAVFSRFWDTTPATPTPSFGPFTFFAWLAPAGAGSAQGYALSDGEGGAHALLFGFVQNGSNISFNMNFIDITNTSGPTVGAIRATFDDGYPTFVGCSWDGAVVRVYNGNVKCGELAYAGTRGTGLYPSGQGGTIYIGGSDHSMFSGRIMSMALFENICLWQEEDALPQIPNVCLPYWFDTGNFIQYDAAWCANFTDPHSSMVMDYSPIGFDGVRNLPENAAFRRRHPGWYHCSALGAGESGMGVVQWGTNPDDKQPLRVLAPDFPLGDTLTANPVPVVSGLSIPGAPGGSKVFDSFTRSDSYCWYGRKSTLGSTESGSLGSLTWQYGGPTGFNSPNVGAWGISGRQACQTNGALWFIAWVDMSALSNGDMDVYISRNMNGVYNVGKNWTSLVFRVQDKDNFWFAAVDSSGLNIGHFTAGVFDFNQAITQSGGTGWSTLRVRCVSNTIDVFTDATNVATVTSSYLSGAKGAGLGHSHIASRQTESLARFFNFTVK